MEKCDLGSFQPSRALIHGLVNQLTVILGFCDLMLEDELDSSERKHYLTMMRTMAGRMADDLNRHQCQLDDMVDAITKKPL